MENYLTILSYLSKLWAKCRKIVMSMIFILSLSFSKWHGYFYLISPPKKGKCTVWTQRWAHHLSDSQQLTVSRWWCVPLIRTQWLHCNKVYNFSRSPRYFNIRVDINRWDVKKFSLWARNRRMRSTARICSSNVHSTGNAPSTGLWPTSFLT